MSSDIIEEKNNTILKLTLILDKLFLVLGDFRQNLNDFEKSCQCVENFRNKLNFNQLEDDYQTIVEEYHGNKSKIDEELDLIESTADTPGTDPKTNEDVIHCKYEDCIYKTSKQRNMKNHMSHMHLNKSRIQCRKCQFQCWGNLSLREHMRCHYRTLTSTESQCLPQMTNNSVDSTVILPDYVTNLTEFKNIVPIVEQPSSSVIEEQEEDKLNDNNCDENEDNFVLDSMEATADQQTAVPQSNKKLLECVYEDCDYKTWTQEDMSQHKQTMHLNSWPTCPYRDCYFQSAYMSGLQHHIASIHKGKQKLSCDKCQFQCWGSTRLKAHMVICMSESDDWVNCSFPYCHQRFANRTSLSTHIKHIHKLQGQERPILACNLCQFKCWTFNGLRLHYNDSHKSHILSSRGLTLTLDGKPLTPDNGLAPNKSRKRVSFKCPKCPHSYTSGSQLNHHINWIHSKANKIIKDGKFFRCFRKHCAFFDKDRSVVIEHLKSDHGTKKAIGLKDKTTRKYQCHSCYITFVSSNQLRQHLIRRHSIYCGLSYETPGAAPSAGTDVTASCQSSVANNVPNQSINVIESTNSSLVMEQPSRTGFKDIPKAKRKTSSNLFNHLIRGNQTNEQKECEDVTTDENPLLSTMPTECRTNISLRPRKRGSRKLMCEFCGYEAVNIIILGHHMKFHHSSYRCDTCSTIFRSLEKLEEHRTNDHCGFTLNYYICGKSLCLFECNDRTLFEEHQKSHSSNPPLSETNKTTINEQSIDSSKDHLSDNSKNDQLFSKQSNSVVKSEPQQLLSPQEVNDSDNRSVAEENTVSSAEKSDSEVFEGSDEQNNDSGSDPSVDCWGEKRPEECNLEYYAPNLTNKNFYQKLKVTLLNGKYQYYMCCSLCSYKTLRQTWLIRHMKGKHSLFYCTICQKCLASADQLKDHISTHYDRNRPTTVHKCDANECDFQCNDSKVFTQHKRQHLERNIDKIITEFQSGIKRVQIKTEIDEQDNDFVNPQQFLAQNCEPDHKNTGILTDEKAVKLSTDQNQNNGSTKQLVAECQPSLSTVKRIRGLNSAREPIRLANKSAKKISELFKT